MLVIPVYPGAWRKLMKDPATDQANKIILSAKHL